MVGKKIGPGERSKPADSSELKDVAVAIVYDEAGMKAPAVAAIGERELARIVKRYARRYGIPVRLERKLAEALVGLGPDDPVPAGLFESVARVLVDLERRKTK